jgi:hypothetical protein
MHSLLEPGGELTLLLFPVDASLQSGPPFHQEPSAVSALLQQQGFQQLQLAALPQEQSHKARAGREWLGQWRKPLAAVA